MIALLLAGALAAQNPGAEKFVLRTALHIHTTFSDGSHAVEHIAHRARDEGIDAVLLADHFSTRVEYGPPLFRGFAVSVQSPSLNPRDLERYWETSRRVEREIGVLVLPGVEVTPFYYWQGSPLAGDLSLNAAHRHLVVFFPDNLGLSRIASTLSQMSAPGASDLRADSLLLVWPALPALWAASRLRRRHRRGQSWLHRLVLWTVLAIGGAALILSWPYRVPRHSPYAGDAGVAPYQDVLDASRPVAALTFWAHPETSIDVPHPRYPVVDRSEAYPELIAATHRATGFASLYEGDRRAAAPGGPWDETSGEFLSGDRLTPLWTVGELDLHREGEAGGKFLGEVETVVFAEDRSRQALIEALARGAMYAIRQPEESRLSLDRFRALCLDEEVRMGGRTSVAGPCRIDARLSVQGEPLEEVTVSLIRNGEVFATQDVDLDEGGVDLEWNDESRGEPRFYRLVAKRGNRVALYANPLFVGAKETAP